MYAIILRFFDHKKQAFQNTAYILITGSIYSAQVSWRFPTQQNMKTTNKFSNKRHCNKKESFQSSLTDFSSQVRDGVVYT
jgi:hypothetical protein